jgi:hypothetical protein
MIIKTQRQKMNSVIVKSSGSKVTIEIDGKANEDEISISSKTKAFSAYRHALIEFENQLSSMCLEFGQNIFSEENKKVHRKFIDSFDECARKAYEMGLNKYPMEMNFEGDNVFIPPEKLK